MSWGIDWSMQFAHIELYDEPNDASDSTEPVTAAFMGWAHHKTCHKAPFRELGSDSQGRP